MHAYPSYFVYGPLVLSPATEDLVGAITSGTNGAGVSAVRSALGSPLIARRGDKPEFDGEELVVVPSLFFPHKLSKGYSNPAGRVVKTINGVRSQGSADTLAVWNAKSAP